MKEITEYQVLYAYGRDEIELNVSAAIAEGWQPIGGVSISSVELPNVGKKIIWAQAVVKYEE
jgi:hypothetical protein